MDEAGATALAFLNALGNNQPDKLCAMFTARALAKLGGLEKCTTAFTQEDPTGDPDFAAVDTLSHAWAAAKKSATKRHGDSSRSTSSRLPSRAPWSGSIPR